MSDYCTSGIVGRYISSPARATVTLIGAGGGGIAFRAPAGGVAGGGVGGTPAIRADARAGVNAMVVFFDFLGVRRRCPWCYFSIGFYCFCFDLNIVC